MILFARAPASPAAELVLEPVSNVLGRQVEAVEALATGLATAGRGLSASLGPTLTAALVVLVVVPALAALLGAAAASVRTAATALRRRAV